MQMGDSLMADDVLKRLLVRLSVDRSEFDSALAYVRSQLAALRSGEQSAHDDEQSALTAISRTRKDILDTVKQTSKAQEDYVSQIDRLQISIQKAGVEEKAQLELNTARLELMQQEVAQSELLLKNLNAEVALERQRISLEEARFKAQTTGVRGSVSQAGTPGVISNVRSTNALSQKGASAQAGAVGKTVIEQKQELEIEKQVVTATQAELKVQEQLLASKKANIAALTSEIAREREKLALLQQQYNANVRNAAAAEKAVLAQKANVGILQTQLKANQQVVTAKNLLSVSGAFKTDDQLATSEKDAKNQLTKLDALDAQLKRLAEQEGVNAEFVKSGQEEIAQARTLLNLELERVNAMKQRKAGIATEMPKVPAFAVTPTASIVGTVTQENEKLTVLQAESKAKQAQLASSKAEVEVTRESVGVEEQKARAINQEVVEVNRKAVEEKKAAQASQLAAQQTIHPENMARIAQQLEATSAIGKMSRVQIEDKIKELEVERQELITQQAILRTLGEKQGYTKAEIALANQNLKEQMQILDVQYKQLQTKKAQSGDTIFTRFGTTLNNVMQKGIGTILGVGGGSGAAEGGGGGGVLGGLGQVAGGVVLGGIGFEALDKLAETLGELKKALIEASGPAQTFRKEFERLSEMKGIDPEELLGKLRENTRGLTADEQLFMMANRMMSSSLKMSSDQMLTLIRDTTDLGISTGHSSQEISKALELAFLNPQRGMMALARVTGISTDKLRESMQGLSRDIGVTARAQIEASGAAKAIAEQVEKVGRPLATLPQLFQQLHNVQSNFIEDVATSALKAGNFNEAIDKMSKWLIQVQPQLRQYAEMFGQTLAKAISFVTEHAGEIKLAFEALIAVKVLDWGLQLIGWAEKFGGRLDSLITKVLGLKRAEEELAAVKGVTSFIPGAGISTAEKGVESVGESAAVQGTEKAGESTVAKTVEGTVVAEGFLASLTKMRTEGHVILASIPVMFEEMTAGISVAIKGLPALLSGMWTALPGIVSGVVASVGESLLALKAVISGISLASIEGGLVAAFTAITDLVVGVGAALVAGFGAALAAAWPITVTVIAIAAAIALVVGFIYKLKDSFVQANGVAYSLGQTWKAFKLVVSDAIDSMTVSWHKFITGTSDNAWINSLGRTFHAFGEDFGTIVDWMHKKWLNLTDEAMPDAMKGALAKVAAQEAAAKKEAAFTANFDWVHKLIAGAPKTPSPEQDKNAILTRELAQLQAKIDEAQLKNHLSMQKQAIDEELEMWKQRYELGIVDFADYMAKQRSLRAQQLTVTLAELEQERRVRKQEIEDQATASGQSPKKTAKQEQLVDVEIDQKELQARHQSYAQQRAMEEQYLNDSISARRAYQSVLLKLSKDELAQKQKDLEDDFKQGTVSANDYINQRAVLITQQYEAAKKELEQELADTKKSDDEKAKIQRQIYEAEASEIKELNNLYSDQDKIRLDGLDNAYNRMKEVFTAEKEIAEAGIDAGEVSAYKARVAAMERLRDITAEYIGLLKQQFALSNGNFEIQAKIGQELGKATEDQVKQNIALAQARDIAGPLSEVFGSISSELGGILKKQWSGFFSTLSKSLDTLSKLNTKLANVPTATGGGIGGGIQSAAQVAQQMEQQFEKGLTDASGNTLTFSTYLTEAGKGTKEAMNMASEAVTKLTGRMNDLRAEIEGLVLSEKSKTDDIQRGMETERQQDAAQGQQLNPPLLGAVAPEGQPAGLGNTVGTPTLSATWLSGTVLGPNAPGAGTQSLSGDFSSTLSAAMGTWTNGTKAVGAGMDSLKGSMLGLQGVINGITGSQPSIATTVKGQGSNAELISSVLNWPKMAEGGDVLEAGGAVVHSGETVLTAGLTAALKAFMSALNQAASKLTGIASAIDTKLTGAAPKAGTTRVSANLQQVLGVGAGITPKQISAGLVSQITNTPAGKALGSDQIQKLADTVKKATELIGKMGDKSGAVADALAKVVAAAAMSQAAGFNVSTLANPFGNQPPTDSENPFGGSPFSVTNLANLPNLASLFGAQPSVAPNPFSTDPSAGTDTGTGAGGWESAMQTQTGITNSSQPLIAALQELTKAITQQTQQQTGQQKTGGFSGSILGGMGKNFKNMMQGGDAEGGGMGALQSGVNFVQAGMQVAGSIVQVGEQLMHAQSGTAGAVQGTMSGLSMGAELGGPIGAAVGAAVGAVFGGIVGHKNALAQQYVTDIKAQLQGITTAVNNGSLGLGQALQSLISARSSAQSQAASGGKKQEAAWNNTIKPEIDAEIEEIQAQIAQVIASLHSSLEEIMQPTAFQPFIDSLDQIVQKYQQFANAAVGNTQEVANANLYLQQSLQNYLTTLGTQLNQQQQSAIQNALNLINLQQQQLQLDQQHAQNVYSILTQGALSRQLTGAQSKGSQIEAADEQYNIQSQQNQEQISLAQYQFNTQQKIFGLTQDRVGLEQQLLGVQEQQVDLQNQSILALISVMASVQKGISGGAAGLGALMGGTGDTGMAGLLQLLGLVNPGQLPGQQVATISNVPTQYQPYVNYLLTGPMPNIITDLQQAETDSTMRTMLEDELTSQSSEEAMHAAGLSTSDAAWQQFLSWISSGAPGLPAPPSYDVGGLVTDTGLATVHQGEYVFPSGTFQQFVDAMGTLVTTIQTLAQEVNNLVGGPNSTNDLLASNGAIARQGSPLFPTTGIGGSGIGSITVEIANDSLNKLGMMLKLMVTSILPTKTIALPSYDTGGVVPTTGPALLHAGETVLPTHGTAISSTFNSAISDASSGSQLLAAHQQIFDLAQARIGMETTLLQAQQVQTQADMQRIAMLTQLMTQMQSASGQNGVNSLEGSFARVYQLRGRYGSAGFRTETL